MRPKCCTGSNQIGNAKYPLFFCLQSLTIHAECHKFIEFSFQLSQITSQSGWLQLDEEVVPFVLARVIFDMVGFGSLLMVKVLLCIYRLALPILLFTIIDI